ncbi:MAG TPA: hypothetical protein VFT60_13620 [Bryobacteraceae bacterium]|jgi:hypothetical protein|nr:hypothetical protein [Bryobacteraceae bacterium]
MIPWIPEAIAATGAAAGLLAGVLCVWLNQRTRAEQRREIAELRAELHRVRVESLGEMERVAKDLETWKCESQAATEFYEGRLSVTARSRVLRMLRAGIAPEAAAAELGMARSEVQLLKEVAGALAERRS